MFLDFVRLYADDPVAFVKEVLGKKPDPWQEEVLAAYGRRERRISIRSGHGVGKTTLLAWILVHHILFRFPQKALCTAPTSGQLFDNLAADTKATVKDLPPALSALLEIKAERIELRGRPEQSFIAFRTSSADKPEALSGEHSENMLLIADEASGIPEAIYEAATGSMTSENATMILAGNPVRGTGMFYDTHVKMRDLWFTRRVSCLDCSRIPPDYVEQVRRQYGEMSNAFRVRVLGEFPLADDDTVIPMHLLEPALDRDVRAKRVQPIWGVDVARKGRDGSALAKRQGNVLMEPVMEWYDKELMPTAGKIKAEWDGTQPSMRPSAINIDAIGVGAGVADRLRELGLPAYSINVSESAPTADKYENLRTELWFEGRNWFLALDCAIHGELKDGTVWKDEKLSAELSRPTWDWRSNGKIFVEPKKLTMKRLREASPNIADAFLLTFASQAVSMSGLDTAAKVTSWNQPLLRVIKGVE